MQRREAIARRVLVLEPFGMCVCWPRTHWHLVPGPAAMATVMVDGIPRAVLVQTQQCNCQGEGWHEHRFLTFVDQAGLAKGQRVSVDAGAAQPLGRLREGQATGPARPSKRRAARPDP